MSDDNMEHFESDGHSYHVKKNMFDIFNVGDMEQHPRPPVNPMPKLAAGADLEILKKLSDDWENHGAIAFIQNYAHEVIRYVDVTEVSKGIVKYVRESDSSLRKLGLENPGYYTPMAPGEMMVVRTKPEKI